MKNVCCAGILLVLCAASTFGQQNTQQGSAATPQAASDQTDNAALLQKLRDLEDRVILLEGQVRTLKSQQAPPPTPSAAAPPAGVEAQAQPPAQGQPTQAQAGTAESVAQAATPPTATYTSAPTQAGTMGGAGGSAAKALNPDISAIGDFIGVAGHNPIQPSPSLQMHESELGF